MPRYFLHIRYGIDWIDDEGSVLPDLAAARRGAVEGIRQIAAKDDKVGAESEHCVRIANEHGNTLMTVPFRAALQIQGSHTLH
jgi:hypothetical protein